MANRNWSRIESGATFESLAAALVVFEDPGAKVFGRRGPDGGQDVLSSDGRRVYQAKHHQDGSAAKAIADAKNEAAKIAAYRRPGHKNYPIWEGVTDWRLVTNAEFNANDLQRWESEVIPLFEQQGLTIDYWEGARLSTLLDKHPEVDRSYFQNMTRVFLSLPEVRDKLPAHEPFLRRDKLNNFVGRGAEIHNIHSFLKSEKTFLIVHGAGGVGKTRLVIEAGEQIAAEGAWQVLWANVASMESSATWFEGIVPERPTLLIVDEPQDEQILRVLEEQIVGRVSQWKIAVAIQSANDPVLKFLRSPRIKPRVQELFIEGLSQTDAGSMCYDLLGSDAFAHHSDEWRMNAARELARRFSRHPIWLTLAVHVLESSGDLAQIPEAAEGLAEQYLSEVIEKQTEHSHKKVHAVLCWVALVGTLDRENNTTLDLIARQSQLGDVNTVKKILASLVCRRALAERGAGNRLVELKPDVLRDHILLKWLSIDVQYGSQPVQPSDDAKRIIEKLIEAVLVCNFTTIDRSILSSLARSELILARSGHGVPLITTFMLDLRSSISKMTASARAAIAEALVDVAPYQPEETIKVSQLLRSDPVATEAFDGMFGKREVGQDDVVLALAWLVFHAGFGAQRETAQMEVLKELYELTVAESAIASKRVLPNDGKRAKDLLERTLEGNPQFWSDFESAAAKLATERLDDVLQGTLAPSRIEAIKALVQPLVSVKRHQTWSEDFTFHSRTSVILPDHPAWETRKMLITKIRTLLVNQGLCPSARKALWEIIAESHHVVSQCRLGGSDVVQGLMHEELLEDLIWALPVLQSRAGHIDEMSVARNLWHWHVQLEKDPALKAASQQLEDLYKGNELTAEFEGLLSQDDLSARKERESEKAEQLASANGGAIEDFLQRAAHFFGSDAELCRVGNVAWELGMRAEKSPRVQDFIGTTLSETELSPKADFAAIAVTGWAASLRRIDPVGAYQRVVKMAGLCGSPEQRLNLLQRLYGRLPRPTDIGELSPEELSFVRAQEERFVEAGCAPAFVACVAWSLDFDWMSLKTIVERVLDTTVENDLVAALTNLVTAFFWNVRERDPSSLHPDLAGWMLDQVLRVSDIDSLSGNLEWYIDEILDRTGKAPLAWLAQALRRRRDLETQKAHSGVHALSRHMLLSRFIEPIREPVGVEERAVVNELLSLVSDTGSLGHYLPSILQDVDPHGSVVPEEVARKFGEAIVYDDARRLARIGSAYVIGTSAWRTIAKPVVVRAGQAGTDERLSLYSALTQQESRFWSGQIGEVPAFFTDAVKSARERLETEEDHDFRPFWKWRLELAEAELREQEEQAKEVRGE